MSADVYTAVREVAEKIVALTGYGHALHVNDILPDLRDLVQEATAQLKLDNATLRNAQKACEECMTPTYAEIRARLTAANEEVKRLNNELVISAATMNGLEDDVKRLMKETEEATRQRSEWMQVAQRRADRLSTLTAAAEQANGALENYLSFDSIDGKPERKQARVAIHSALTALSAALETKK